MSDKTSKTEVELDKDFDSDERLFHYTSSQGLYGILGSGCLWATHFKFLNDSNEFFAARNSLTGFVEREILKKIEALTAAGRNPLHGVHTTEEISKHETGTIVAAMYTATLNIADPFIFSSFVSKLGAKDFRNGELLHWATYGREGGYAVEINPHKLASILPKETILSLKAVYVDDTPPKELSGEYSEIASVASEMIEAILNSDLQNVDPGRGAAPFMKVASIIKDAYFKGEQEARVVLMRFKNGPSEQTPPSVFVRQSRGLTIPYIKLFENELFGPRSPVEAIIIGPHHDKVRREEALAIYLQSRGLERIEIIQSEVPYLAI